ncbi:hypothetical protein Droror1_Dr00007966 [Drosera rotundifolia]
MSIQHLHPLLPSSPSSSIQSRCVPIHHHTLRFTIPSTSAPHLRRRRRRRLTGVVLVGTEETEVIIAGEKIGEPLKEEEAEEEEEEVEPSPEDLENIRQIKRVLELLRKNRDMLFGEVKLTIMIEDPREVERRRFLGIDDSEAPSREDLVDALVDVNEGRVPKNRIALQMLAEEMISWPNLEVEAPKKKFKSNSPYAKATDTGIDPKEAAKRLNIDWDSAAEIDEADAEDAEVPAAVGYGALYLVTAFPVIIGITVVLILFFNSLQ